MRLRRLLRETIAIFLHFGLFSLVRRFVGRHRATIIVYHDPTPETFAKHLSFLAQYYHFIPMDALGNAIHERDWSSMPDFPLVITIDDGYRNNAKLTQLCRQHSVRPTVYVCSQIVGTNRRFWFLEASEKVSSIVSQLKEMTNDERLRVLKEQIGFDQEEPYSTESPDALSISALNEMKEYVDIGSHTQFHPILTTCSDWVCRREIERPRGDLQQLLAVECNHFAYPNGDYSDRERNMVKLAGYKTARTIDIGWNDVNTDPYALRITGVTDSASTHMLAAQLTGLPGFIRHLASGSLIGRRISIKPESHDTSCDISR